MDNPIGDIPQMPPQTQDKINQVNDLLREIHAELERIGYDPVDDTWIPPWKKGYTSKDVQAIIDALNRRNDPLKASYSGLRIEGVELTQAIQFYDLYGQGSGEESDNMVPLVAGKDLILRVYVERRKGLVYRTPLQFNGVVRYRGKEVRSLNGPRPVQAATALRRALPNDSLNFRIPAADCYGTVNFTVKVSEAPTPSAIYNNSTFNVTAVFHDIPPMKVSGVLVHFTGNEQDWAAPTGIDLVNTLARFRPMLPIPGFDYNVCQVIDYNGDLKMRAGWDNLINTLANMRAASTVRTFFIALLPANVATMPGINLRGIGRWGLAVSSNNDTRALSHELGHAFALDHIDVNGPPGPFDTKYPDYSGFPFGSIGEEGVDTTRMALYNPNSVYDFMTYVENGSPPPLFTQSTWISPYNYKKIMYFIRSTNGTADLILSIAVEVMTKAMLLNFRVYRGGRVEILPSYPVSNIPIVQDARPTLPVMLEIYDRDGRVIASQRCHQHNPYQDVDGAYVDFHEILPWNDNIGEIVFVRDRVELERVNAADQPQLSVRVDDVRRLDSDQEGRADLARVEWSLADAPADRPVSALVRYSPDGGRTWYAVAEESYSPEGHNGEDHRSRRLINLDLLPGGEECRIEVIASSGLASSTAQSEPFAVRRKPRRAYLLSPQDGQTFRAGEPVEFTGAGHSPDFGLSPSDSILWTSSLDGVLGTGSTLVRSDLRPGTHRITLSTQPGAEDYQSVDHSAEVTASVWIKITEADTNADGC